MGKKITRADSGGSEPIGRDEDQIEMDKAVRNIKASKDVNPSEMVAIQAQVINSANSMAPDIQPTDITATASRTEQLVQKAKQQLNGIREAKEKSRYSPDPDPGRKADDERSKDKYVKDTPSGKGKDTLKKLKSNLKGQLARLNEAFNKAKDDSVIKEIRVARVKVRNELTKISSVEEDLRMKKVHYPPEKEQGGKAEDVKRSKDKYISPTPPSVAVTKASGSNLGITRQAMEDDEVKNDKKEKKDDDKAMGGNDMKSLPKDEKKDEKDDKGPQKKELEKAVTEIEEATEGIGDIVEKLEDAAENIGVDIDTEKGEEGIEPKVPFGKPDMKKKEMMPEMGDKAKDPLDGDMLLDKGRDLIDEKKGPLMASKKDDKDDKKKEKEKEKAQKEKEKEKEEAKKKKEKEDKKKDKKATLGDRLSEDGITAVFTPTASKMDSYWTIYNKKEKIIEASVRDIWGKKGFEKWAEVSSPEYGKLIVSRVNRDGFEVTAHNLGVKASLNLDTKKADINIIAENAAPGKGKSPALQKKLTTPEKYISQSEVDKSIKPKLTKRYGSGRNVVDKAEFDKVNAYRQEVEKSNRILLEKLSKTSEELKNAKGDNSKLINESQLRVRANAAIKLADYMVENNVIDEANKDSELEKMMLMDDVSFVALESITENIVTNTNKAEAGDSKSQKFVRTGGLSSVPQMSGTVDKGLKESLENIWTTKIPSKGGDK